MQSTHIQHYGWHTVEIAFSQNEEQCSAIALTDNISSTKDGKHVNVLVSEHASQVLQAFYSLDRMKDHFTAVHNVDEKLRILFIVAKGAPVIAPGFESKIPPAADKPESVIGASKIDSSQAENERKDLEFMRPSIPDYRGDLEEDDAATRAALSNVKNALVALPDKYKVEGPLEDEGDIIAAATRVLNEQLEIYTRQEAEIERLTKMLRDAQLEASIFQADPSC